MSLKQDYKNECDSSLWEICDYQNYISTTEKMDLNTLHRIFSSINFDNQRLDQLITFCAKMRNGTLIIKKTLDHVFQLVNADEYISQHIHHWLCAAARYDNNFVFKSLLIYLHPYLKDIDISTWVELISTKKYDMIITLCEEIQENK